MIAVSWGDCDFVNALQLPEAPVMKITDFQGAQVHEAGLQEGHTAGSVAYGKALGIRAFFSTITPSLSKSRGGKKERSIGYPTPEVSYSWIRSCPGG